MSGSRYESVFIASLQVLDLLRRWQRNLGRSHLAEDGGDSVFLVIATRGLLVTHLVIKMPAMRT